MNKTFAIVIVLCLAALLVIPAMADTFVPSIQQKISPTIESVVIQKNGEKEVLNKNEVIVVSLSEMDGKLSKSMQAAYQMLADKKPLKEVIKGIDEVLADVKNAPKEDDLIVRDLLEVTFGGSTAAIVNKGKGTLAIRFELNLDPFKYVAVAFFNGKEWEMVPLDRVTLDEKGNLTVVMGHDGPIAILTEKTK